MTYGYLKQFLRKEGVKGKTYGNCFYPVAPTDIVKAEEIMGYEFPDQLRKFYKEIGYGFLVAPEGGYKNVEFSGANRINHPLTNAEIFTAGVESGLISGDTLKLLSPYDLPFFEICDSSSFMTMKLGSDNPNAVWYMGSEKIEDSFSEFIHSLYYKGPEYYTERW